jgi:hypothetical protein
MLSLLDSIVFGGEYRAIAREIMFLVGVLIAQLIGIALFFIVVTAVSSL